MNRTCKTLIQALLAGTALTQPGPVAAGDMPVGATTVYGGVGIATPSAGHMTIQQTTSTAIVNWQGFSVGAGNRVDIVQPSASSALLNRVTGSTPSTIAGQINANGQVYLVNPNGIAITPTGVVNAGAFVASTLDVSDQDFAAGRRVFRGTGQSAPVSNHGTIAVQQGGYAALLGGKVDNAGVISVPMGRVGLGAGEQATLDLTGDGFLQVAIPSKADGSDTALIRHSGRIKAAGGQVVMQAATAREMARNAINLSGHVEAHSVSGRNGAIVLGGGDGGRVTLTGRLDTSARGGLSRPGTRQAARGGDITITGNDIQLKGAALLADGQAGGGSVRIGGGFQGKGPLQRASTTTIDAATTISAEAGRTGNGGDVVVWSDRSTEFAGRISARGGRDGGDGGQAEVSGKSVLAYTGLTDLSAAKGRFGTLLLDPYNVTIGSGANANQSGFAATGNDSVINADTLQTALRTANVTVTTGGSGSAGTQAGDITVAAPVTWGTGADGAETTLTLNAYRSIVVAANLTVSGSGGLALNTNQGETGGTLAFSPGASASFIGGGRQSLTVDQQSYRLLRSAPELLEILTRPDSASGRFALATDADVSAFPSDRSINSVPFSGTFEGLGHTINGLTINSTEQYVGLFGQTNNATIANLNLTNVSVRGAYSADSDNGGSISYVGGLVGRADNTTIRGVNVRGTVTNAAGDADGSQQIQFSYTGGLAGFSNGQIVRSSTSGVVNGAPAIESETGGLVGRNDGTGSIRQSFSTSDVNGSTASGVSADTGGLIGWNTSTGVISQVYASGTVRGGTVIGEGTASYTGGLIGYSSSGAISLSQAYASGAVEGGGATLRTETGGLIGRVFGGSINQSYATGSVTAGVASNGGTSRAGGLVGYNGASIDQSYAIGRVAGDGESPVSTGGLVGFNAAGSASASFWNTTTTGQSAAAGNVANFPGATGLTTAQFQDAATFVPLASGQGWNFQTDWAPPSAEFYPELYSLSRVVSVTANAQTRTYGQANPTLTGTVAGGPGTYAFDIGGVQPSATSLLATGATQASGVGDYAITPTTGRYVSPGGVTYRVTGIGNTLTVTPAPLVITADDQSKTAGTQFTFDGTEYTATGLVNGDRITSVALTSDGAPSSAPAGAYEIVPSAATGTGLVNPANNRSNYTIAYETGTLTVGQQQGPNTPYSNAAVTPNVTTILPNFNTAALGLGDTLDLASGGGPTLGVAQSGQGGGSGTRAGALSALASIQGASNALEGRLAACDRSANTESRSIANCYSNSLDGFADTLDIQVQQLPPAFRGLPAIIRQAARQVRQARTVAEARAAVQVAVVAVRKAIALLRADEPVVARIQARQGNAITSALRMVDNRLSRATGL